MNQDIWLTLLPGLLLVVGVVVTIRCASGWYVFRRSIYKEIYSNYFEYVLRKKSLEKLSKSYYFESRFGKHRICYQLASHKGDKKPQAYVIVILSSGMYVLDIKNETGYVEASVKGAFRLQYVSRKKKGEKAVVETRIMRNPIEEVTYFTKKILEKIKVEENVVHPIIVFPDQSTLEWKEKEPASPLPVIHRSDVFKTLQEIHTQNTEVLGEAEIERIYLAIAGDSLKIEKTKNRM